MAAERPRHIMTSPPTVASHLLIIMTVASGMHSANAGAVRAVCVCHDVLPIDKIASGMSAERCSNASGVCVCVMVCGGPVIGQR